MHPLYFLKITKIMERVPKDVILTHILCFFDGRTAAMFASTCKFYRMLTYSNIRCVKLMRLHHIQIGHPCEFLRTIGCEKHRRILTAELLLVSEGRRSCWNGKDDVVSFNDFYGNSSQIEREIYNLKDKAKQYLLITYEPVKVGRFDLGGNLGTIHRGTSIVVYT